MFKALGIIESFGTGIGEAKRSLDDNGSPELYYKIFDPMDNITSVVIPVNEEYIEAKKGINPKKNLGIQNQSKDFKRKVSTSGYTKSTKRNLILLYEKIGTEIFGSSKVMDILNCSGTTATSYIKNYTMN